MDIRELKHIVNTVDPDAFASQVFVIVGTDDDGRGAEGVDVADARLSFDNGGPVFVIITDRNITTED